MKFTKPFFFGIIAALGALFLELLIGMITGSSQSSGDISFTLITPLLILMVLVEELSKFIFIYRNRLDLKINFHSLNRPEWIKKDIFLNSFFIGVGFSFMELLLVVSGTTSLHDFSDLRLAVPGIIIIHAATASFMGYFLENFESLRFFSIPIVLPATTAVHLFYNYLIIHSVRPLFVIFYLLFLALIFSAMILKVSSEKADKAAS